MRKDYEKLFSRLEHTEPPDGLLEGIMLRIADEKRRRVLAARAAAFGAVSLAAFLAFVPAWRELQSESARTGFPQLLSLAFSDGATVATYWQDFVFSLLESLPVFGVAAVLGALFAFFASLKFFVRVLSLMPARIRS